MGFLDNIKDAVQERLRPQDARDDYFDGGYDEQDGYGEEPYDEGTYDEEPASSDAQTESRSRAGRRASAGMLGNPSRPEANSVSVYTRSGRQLSGDDLSLNSGGYREESGYRDDGAYRTADDSWRASADHVVDPDAAITAPQDDDTGYVPPIAAPGVFGTTGNTPGDVGLTAVPRVASGKLPPYVLKPTSYDDVQMVIRRVRTNQPVVLSFKSLKLETAKRILDFCFGLACGIDGTVEELNDRVFVVLPHGVELTAADLEKLRAAGLSR